MAPKKKSTKKTAAAESGKKKATWVRFVPSEDPILQRGPAEQWVSVRVCSITWSVMDFSLQLLAEKPIMDLVSHIKERHGGGIDVSALTLYRDEVHPRNLLSDLWQTIGHLLPESGDGQGGAESLTFHYDFQPIATDCAIVLRAPNNSKIEGTLAVEKAAAASKAARVRDRRSIGSTDTASATAREAVAAGRRTNINGVRSGDNLSNPAPNGASYLNRWNTGAPAGTSGA